MSLLTLCNEKFLHSSSLLFKIFHKVETLVSIMANTTGSSDADDLLLTDRTNDIYASQIKHMMKHVSKLKTVIKDKSMIIDNLIARYKMGVSPIAYNQESDLEPDVMDNKQLGIKAAGLLKQVLSDNQQLKHELTYIWTKFDITPKKNISLKLIENTIDFDADKVEKTQSDINLANKINLSDDYKLKIEKIMKEKDNYVLNNATKRKLSQKIMYIYSGRLRDVQDVLCNIRLRILKKEKRIKNLIYQYGGDCMPCPIKEAHLIENKKYVKEWMKKNVVKVETALLINDNWLRLQYYQEWMELIVTAYVKDEDMRLLAVKDLVLCYYNKWIDIDDYFKKIV